MNYTFRTKDHPQANGRTPQAGEVAYRLFFPLEEGGILTVKVGKVGLEALRTVMGQMAADETHRADGWPLCPCCGEDELSSALFWDGLHPPERPPLAEYIAAGLTCYRCGWTQEPSEKR